MPAKPKPLTFPQKIQAAQGRVGGLVQLCYHLNNRDIKISYSTLWRWATGKMKAHPNHVAVIGKELDRILRRK